MHSFITRGNEFEHLDFICYKAGKITYGVLMKYKIG